MRLPTPFQPSFQPGSKVYSNPYSNPLPTPVPSTPHTPHALRTPLEGERAQSWEGQRLGKVAIYPAGNNALEPGFSWQIARDTEENYADHLITNHNV